MKIYGHDIGEIYAWTLCIVGYGLLAIVTLSIVMLGFLDMFK
jgi:hypothetical protein